MSEEVELYMTKTVKTLEELEAFIGRFRKWLLESTEPEMRLADLEINLTLKSLLESKRN